MNTRIIWLSVLTIAILITYLGIREHRITLLQTSKKDTAEQNAANINYLYLHSGYFSGVQPTTFDPDTLAQSNASSSPSSPYGIFFTG